MNFSTKTRTTTALQTPIALRYSTKRRRHSGRRTFTPSAAHSQAADKLTKEIAFGYGVTPFGHDEIATLAYELWQARGCPYGSPEEDWSRAESEIRARVSKHCGMTPCIETVPVGTLCREKELQSEAGIYVFACCLLSCRRIDFCVAQNNSRNRYLLRPRVFH
jgi:Protein of unknown function (DUF2934)